MINIFKISVVISVMTVVSTEKTSHIWKVHKQDATKCCSTDPDRPSNNCRQTSLVANNYIQAVISPGYPDGLPSSRQCTWTIQSRPGKRVRIDFRDFYLVGPNQEGSCEEQFIMVLSSLNYKMGPFCGNTGLQSIVSPDNLMVVQLEIGKSYSTENYRGFRMEFTETEETPSQQLRPPNWKNQDDMFLVGSQLDKAIEQFNPNKGATVHNNQQTPATRPTSKPKQIGSAKKGVAKKAPTIYRNNQRIPPIGRQRPNFYGPMQHPGYMNNNNKPAASLPKKSKSGLLLKVEVIVGIAVGGLVFVALLILISCKICQGCGNKPKPQQQTTNTEKQESPQKDTLDETYANAANTKISAKARPDQGVRTHPTTSPVYTTQQPPEYIGHQSQVYQSYPLPPAGYATLPGYSANAQPERLSNDVEKMYGTLQTPSNHQMMLYDPNTGHYFDPYQLQAVQSAPVYAAQEHQGMVGNYATMPHQQSTYEANKMEFYSKYASMQQAQRQPASVESKQSRVQRNKQKKKSRRRRK